MAAWTDIANALVAVGAKPFASLMQALRDNPIAIAEGAAGAPKIRQVNVISAAAAATQTFTGLDEYEGVMFDIMGQNSGGAAANLQFSYSTDGGSTWSTAVTIESIPTVNHYFASGHFNFATGAFGMVGKNLSSTSLFLRTSATIAGASLAINAIRFTTTGTQTLQAIIRPAGATV